VVWLQLAAWAIMLTLTGCLWWYDDWTGGYLVMGSFVLGWLIRGVQN
jgi:hypothetical protein